MLEHIKDDKDALSQWVQWLRPGGCLVISVPVHMSRWNASDKWAGHYRCYEKRGIVSVLQGAGMTIETIESYGFPLANLMEPTSAWNREREMRSRDFSGDQDTSTSHSGVERQTESRRFSLLSSWPGVKTLQFFCWLPSFFVATDLGNGYLVLFRK